MSTLQKMPRHLDRALAVRARPDGGRGRPEVVAAVAVVGRRGGRGGGGRGGREQEDLHCTSFAGKYSTVLLDSMITRWRRFRLLFSSKYSRTYRFIRKIGFFLITSMHSTVGTSNLCLFPGKISQLIENVSFTVLPNQQRTFNKLR